MRRHRSDLNQTAIVEAMRQVGAEVFCVGQPFDLIVAFHGRLWLADCKAVGGDWTPAQLKSIARFNRQSVGVWRLESPEDALRMIGLRSVTRAG